MKKLKKWFIGDYINKTENVFEKARIELTYDYTLFFFVLGLVFYGNLISNSLWYHFYVVTFACLSLSIIPFILKYKQSLTMAGNWFVIQQTLVSFASVYVQEVKPDISGPIWTMSFIIFILFVFGVKRGLLRLIPFISIFIVIMYCHTNNIVFDFGIPQTMQLPNQPFVAMVPFCLCVYLIMVFMRTNGTAEKKIKEQKTLVETKNKEITDSIHYAKRIQDALMPNNNYIERTINELKK